MTFRPSTGTYTQNLLEFNAGASAALAVINPLSAQIDFALFGSLGIGALQANLQAQLQAALKASFDIGLNISNPLIGFQLALSGIAGLSAQISAALSGALPAVSIDATGQLSATAALAAILQLQIGGLEALISGALKVKLPAVGLAADFALKLQAGPIKVLAWDGQDMSSVESEIHSRITPAFSGSTYGMIIVTQSSAAWDAMLFFFGI
jgi:hypothetical protein